MFAYTWHIWASKFVELVQVRLFSYTVCVLVWSYDMQNTDRSQRDNNNNNRKAVATTRYKITEKVGRGRRSSTSNVTHRDTQLRYATLFNIPIEVIRQRLVNGRYLRTDPIRQSAENRNLNSGTIKLINDNLNKDQWKLRYRNCSAPSLGENEHFINFDFSVIGLILITFQIVCYKRQTALIIECWDNVKPLLFINFLSMDVVF